MKYFFFYKKLYSAGVIACIFFYWGVTPGAAKTNDPFVLYPQNIEFNVRRNGSNVGRHLVSFFKLSNNQIRVIAELNLKIKILGIPLYDYYYRSEADWYEDRLINLRVDQNDDGKRMQINVSKQNKLLRIEGPDGISSSRLDIFPTNHWNAAVLNTKQVINTISGRIANVTITKMMVESIRAEGKQVNASKFTYSGDFKTHVWYDSAGRWVKMEFTGKDGSLIEYACIKCGIPDGTPKPSVGKE
jgi:hypothetical protein